MSIDVENMQIVAEVFQESFQQLMLSYQGQTAYSKLSQFVTHVVLVEKPYLMVTGEGLSHMIGLVFSDQEISDFVLTLTFNFTSRLGADSAGAFMYALAEMLGTNATFDLPSRNEYCAIPTDIVQRLGDRQQAGKLLASNRWLMTLLLMQMFVSVTEQPKKEG